MLRCQCRGSQSLGIAFSILLPQKKYTRPVWAHTYAQRPKLVPSRNSYAQQAQEMKNGQQTPASRLASAWVFKQSRKWWWHM